MFAKVAERYGCPSYGPSRRSRELGRWFKTLGRGPAAYAAILVAEEILDVFQRDLIRDDRVQPLSREVSRIHVVEEARHMRFAREEILRRAPSLSRVQRAHQRGVLATVALIIVRSLVHPDVYAAVGLDVGVAVRAARSNEAYAERLRSAAAPLVGLLREAGLIGGPSERLWRSAGLV
jgi:P-aminobenzoate N-oxygenase AurF